MDSNLVSDILNDEARKAAAQKAINKHLMKFIGLKVATIVVVAGAIVVVNKIIENKMQTPDISE